MQNMSLYGGNPQQAMYAHHGNHMVSVFINFQKKIFQIILTQKLIIILRKQTDDANLFYKNILIKYFLILSSFLREIASLKTTTEKRALYFY